MYSSYNNKFNSHVVNIFVGEYYVTKKNEIISTLLGSCVSVCLMDFSNKVYGMNHFLLPESATESIEISKNTRFGLDSMENMINKMVDHGAQREKLQAKIFGGGKIIETMSDIITVNSDNIRFTRKFLASEGIPLLSEDVGGENGRIIYFDTFDGSVYVEKINKGKSI